MYKLSTILPIFMFPFMAFVVNAFLGRKLPRKGDWLATLGIILSFVYSLIIFKDFMSVYSADYYVHKVFNWIDLSHGNNVFKIDLGIYLDNMSVIMLLMVTGVASLIHIFSTWYMDHDSRHGRFFVYLPLFTSAMIGLVLSNNLLMLFIFWEIMGFCSYSLIGIYNEKEKAGDASIKAFMTTRVGDVLFLLGILAIWSVIGNVNYVDIYAAVANGTFQGHTVLGISLTTFAAFTIFCGNIGKSAQFPLQVWLPDAMMGPTPGSALIHAATMVAAGVYLSLRIFPLLDAAGLLPFVAFIGGITALGAATIALVQTDIKAVLAYSTISQLGYMVLGIGVGSYNAAFMHIITHAIFKACLFMSAGSVIHAIHEQEMPKMGGLRKKLPYTFIAMMCCTLAIAGIPMFTGFVSKDRILGDALYLGFFADQPWYMTLPAIMGFMGALLTPFYMFRMMFLTFFGQPRDHHVYDHCHEEHLTWNHNVPLLILSIFTLGVFFSGSLTGQGIVKIFPKEKMEWFKVLVEAPDVKKFIDHPREELGRIDTRPLKIFPTSEYNHQSGYYGPNYDEHKLHSAHVYGAIGSIIVALLGVFLAYLMYIRKTLKPATFVNAFSGWYRALLNKYYFDDLYVGLIIKKGLLNFNRALSWFDMGVYDRFAIDGWEKVNRVMFRASRWFDNVIIDSVGVDGVGTSVNIFNLILRIIQSGKIQFYFIVLIFVVVSYIWGLKI
jgi:NADH-quinone oxidoreductase subunit L